MTASDCRDCGRPLRPKRTTAREWPGTVYPAGRGLCNTDYKARTEAGTLDEVPTLPRGDHAHKRAEDDPDRVGYDVERNRAGLLAYILARRASGLPDDGTLRRFEALKELG